MSWRDLRVGTFFEGSTVSIHFLQGFGDLAWMDDFFVGCWP